MGLALVHQRLGQPAEARQWLDRAVAWQRERRCGPGREDDPLLWPASWWGTLSFEVLRREAETVFAEVRDGLVSVEKARASYGVAVLPDLSGVDEAETARLRGARA